MSSEYWKNHYQAASLERGASLLKQVGKTLNGKDVPQEQIEIIIENIKGICRLRTTETVLDLCCGNGLLTSLIASHVKSIIGVDFSPGLIDTAEKYSSSENASYICKDILALDNQLFDMADNIIMYEALQHFSLEEFRNIARKFRESHAGAHVLIGSIPDRAKMMNFYDTDEKMEFYKLREEQNRPHLGRWWHKNEIREIAEENGFSANFLNQDTRLYTAHYRFDVLMETS